MHPQIAHWDDTEVKGRLFVRKLVLGEVRTRLCFTVIIIIGDFGDLKSLSLIRFGEFIISICP